MSFNSGITTFPSLRGGPAFDPFFPFDNPLFRAGAIFNANSFFNLFFNPWLYGYGGYGYGGYGYGGYGAGYGGGYGGGGYGGGGGGYYGGSAMNPYGGANTPTSMNPYASAGGANPSKNAPAQVSVRVPTADAEVWFNGEPSPSQGWTRVFNSPPLDPAYKYEFTVRARWLDNGQVITAERRIRITAGDQVLVNFKDVAQGNTGAAQGNPGY